jgi:hypothetical protein
MFPHPHVDSELLAAQFAARQQPDPVVFVEVPESRPVTAASLAIKEAEVAAARTRKIKVRVNNPYRVIHEGNAFVGGQTLSVPDDLELSRWIESGWVTKVKGK